MKDIPVDHDLSIEELTADPYPTYARLRRESPLLEVPAIGRVIVTKAAHTKYIKDRPQLFSSDDPSTPMERAFQAKTLMRRDGVDHMRLRKAMLPSFTAKNIREVWTPIFAEVVEEYVDRLDRTRSVDLFPELAAPVAARGGPPDPPSPAPAHFANGPVLHIICAHAHAGRSRGQLQLQPAGHRPVPCARATPNCKATSPRSATCRAAAGLY